MLKEMARIVFLLFLVIHLSFQDGDGICRDIENPPIGFYPLRRTTTGRNIYSSDTSTQASLIGINYAKDIDDIAENSVVFNGREDSYIEIPRSKVLDTKSNMTIVISINPSGEEGDIFTYRPSGGGLSITQRKGSSSSRSSSVFIRYVKRSLRLLNAFDEEILTKNEWNHIATTYNFQSGEAMLYKNGEHVKTLQIGKTYMATQFAIRLGYFKGIPFHGQMSCLQIYNHVLDASSIMQSQYVCRKASIILKQTKVEIQKKEFIEPFDQVKLIITEENPDINLVINFGDGTKELHTRDREMTYAYKKLGLYEIKVEFCLGCRSNHVLKTIPLKVYMYVEQPAGLQVNSIVTGLGDESHLKATLERGSYFNCTWYFGDDSETMITVHENDDKEITVTHKYTKAGVYLGQVQCYNRKKTLDKQFKATIQQTLKGLQIWEITPKVITQTFKVFWTLKEGSTPKYRVFVNGKSTGFQTFQDGLKGEINVYSYHFDGQPGEYEVKVQVENDVTEELIAKRMCLVYPEIQPVTIETNKRIYEVNETIHIIAISINEEFHGYPLYDWRFGDGSEKFNQSNNHTTHSYVMYEPKDIEVVTYNPVSSSKHTVTIDVLKPVIHLEKLQCHVDTVSDQETSTLKCNMGLGSDFLCKVDWHGFQENEKDLTSHKYYLNQSISTSHVTNVNFEDKYKFEESNHYVITINCHNRLSHVSHQTKAVVQTKVTGIEIAKIDPQIFGNDFLISWKTSSGTDIVYRLDWNGEDLGDYILHEGKPAIKISQKHYKQPGLYTFTVKAFNNITEELTSSIQIIIEYDVVAFDFDIVTSNDFLEVNEKMTVKFQHTNGTNVQYHVMYGDGNEVTSIKNEYTTSYENYGVFTVSVDAFNNVSNVKIKKQIEVLKPVIELGKLIINSLKENVSKSVQISARLSSGSDFRCCINYGDGNEQNTTELYTDYFTSKNHKIIRNYRNLVIKFEHAFNRAQNYQLNLTCSNRLSKTQAATTVEIFRPVVAFKINSPVQNEKNEPITFQFSTENEIEFTKHEYSIQYGDGNQLFTSENEVTHAYGQYGVYNVIVTAENPVSKVKIIKKIEILKPTIKLVGLKVSASPVNVTDPTVLTISLKQGSDFNCSIQWTAEHVEKINKMKLRYFSGLDRTRFEDIEMQASYRIGSKGRHEIYVTCSNRLGSVSMDKQVIVQEPLKGFFFIPTLPQVFGESFYIKYVVQSGSELNIKFTFNNRSVPILSNKNQVKITPDMYTEPGIITYSMSGSNLVTSEITRQGKVIIDKKVKDLKLSMITKTTVIEVNETLTVQASVSKGSSVMYSINTQDGHTQKDLNQNVFQHKYSVYGKYSMEISAYNNVSRLTESIDIDVMKPVLPLVGLQVTTVKDMNISTPYTINVNLDQGSDFFCNIDCGDGRSHNTSVIYSTYFTKEPRLSKKEYTNIQITANHVYSKPGNYQIAVTCENRLNIKTASMEVRIHVPLTKFEVVASNNIAEINETITFKIKNVDVMTKPTFFINGGQYAPSFSTEKFEFESSFSHHGTFDVVVKTTNPTSTKVQSIQVKVLKPVLKLESLSISTNPTNITEETSLKLNLKKGSDFTCIIQWNDQDIDPVEKSFPNYIFYNDRSLDQTAFTNIVINIGHTYSNIDAYKITATCSNRKNTVMAETNVDVQAPIEGFKLLEVSPKRVGSSFKVQWIKSAGTNVEYTVEWDGQELQYQRLKDKQLFASVTPDNYKKAGIFSYIVTARNKVSNAGQRIGTVILEDILQDLKVQVRSDNPIIEVNETISVVLSLVQGSNPHFKYFRGDESVPVQSMQEELSMSYIKQGTYIIKVIAQNNVSRIEGKTSLTVIKPVLLVSHISLRLQDAYMLYRNAEIVVNVERGSDLTCAIKFGNGKKDTSKLINGHYYENGMKERMEEFENFEYKFNHNYTIYGVYDVAVTCSNRISSKSTVAKIHIQQVLSGIQIKSIPPKKVGEEFHVVFHVYTGSYITYQVNFQNKTYVVQSESNAKQSLKLTSETAGIFTIFVNATNEVTGIITEQLNVVIEKSITQLTVTSPKPDTQLEVGQMFDFCYAIISGSNPTYNVTIDGKDIVGLSEEVCVQHTFPMHQNFSTGVESVKLPLKVIAYNNVSSSEKIVFITILKPVLDLTFESLECLPAITGQSSRLSLKISGSDFNCSWDMETKEESINPLSNILHKDEMSDVTQFQNITKEHHTKYNSAKAYTATVTCANRRTSIKHSTLCYVQDNIRNIKIDPIKARLFGSSPNVTWSTEAGTNITYDVTLDNHTIEVQPIGDKHYVTISKDLIQKPGYYRGVISASNLVTKDYTASFIIKFERDLKITDISITLHEDINTNIEREGHGESSLYFPIDQNISFTIETNTDDFTAVWGIYLYGEIQVSRTSKNFDEIFQTPGTRLVKYRVFNNISSVNGEREITVIELVGFLLLTSNSPQMIGEQVNFTIVMPNKGQETCFMLDTGDGNQYYYTTENGDCRVFYPNMTANISGIFPKHNNTLLVSHIYTIWNFYKASVTAINHLSQKNSSTVVLASQVKCNFPEVKIVNLGETPFHATRLAKSEKMTAYVNANITCEYTSKVTYHWTLFKYNLQTGTLSPVRFDNKTDYGFDPYIMKDLIIKKKVLHYGIYLLKVIVTMNRPKAAVFKTSARGYLEIYPSALFSAIEGGALIRRGMGKKLEFSGGVSYDPDIGRNKYEGMNFTWLCFNAMEKPPKEFETYEIPNYKVAVLNPKGLDPNIVRKGGCYGNGTYLFKTKTELFYLDTNLMIPEQTYVMMLLVTKDDRATVGSQVLELVKGLPPELGIQCRENCMNKINPSGKLALMGTCKGDVCQQDIKYQWEVYKVKHQTLEGKIIWELDQEVMTAVEQYTKELVFVIKKFILTPGKLYRFTLIGGLEDGAKGLAQRNGLTNTPPKNGHCYADQDEGEAMETEFTFTCDGWEDEDIPLRLEFVYFNDRGAESTFFFGASNVATGKLPLGDEKTNFTTRMELRIIDAFEATAKVTLYVKVVAPTLTEDEMIAKLLNMTQGENSELEKIVNSGDTQAIAKLMSAVCSILNKNSDSAGERKKERTKMLSQLSQYGTIHINGSVLFHNGTILHSNATAVLNNGTVVQKNGTVFHPNGTTHDNGTWLFGNNTGLNITELTEEQRRQRDREAIRTAMIVALSNQKSTSLEAMRQNADVMGSLTKSKGEVTAESQESSAGSLMGMAGQLSGESSDEDGAGSDAVESTAGTMASGLGNLIGSAAGSAKAKIVPKPTTTPAPSTTVSILGFEMLFSDEEEEVVVSDEDEDYVETDPTKLKAQATVAGVFSAAGQVGGSMTGKKLPGEESTIIDSPSMAMASGQVDPKKMGAPVCSPSGAGFKMPKNGNLFKNAGNETEMNAVGQQMMALNDNPFSWDPKGGVSGAVTSVTMSSGGGGGMNVNGTDEPMEITMPREGEPDPPTLIEFPPLTQKYVYHKVEIMKNNTALTAHIIPQNYSEAPFNGTVMLGIYLRRNYRPTKDKADWSMIFPKESNETYDPCNLPPPEANYTLFVSDEYLSAGIYWIGVAYLPPPGMRNEALVNVTLNYTLRIFTSQCKYWNDDKGKWMTDGCHVGPKTDMTKTHCLCSHLTSFGGGLITAPAPIDFSKVMAGFKDMFASGNVSVFFSIIGMFGLYILLAVYSRRMDKKEEGQMGVTPIFNTNDPDSNYQYELTFITNRGSNSGTSANVFMNLVGKNGETGAIPLKDLERPLFIPGAVNSFLIMVPKSLGNIEHIRIWHDNSGYYPSWNLNKINMKDLQSKETWIFIGGWFALDEGDFEIDKTIKPATDADLSDFKLLFQEKLMQDLGDAHIWFSIFMRPPTSRFTRLQRLSCCLTILCLTMVASAMFYGAGPASAADDANAISVGPVTVSLKMVIIGIQASIVVVPPNILIVVLFTKARRRNAITIEGSLKKARDKKETEECDDDGEEEITSCCCFKRKRKRKNKSSCFRCCRTDDPDSEDDFDDIGEMENDGYDNDEEVFGRQSRLSRSSRASSRISKPRIRGYYQSSSESSSDESYISSSNEEDTSPESDSEPLLDMEEIDRMEKESKILIEDGKTDEKPDCITKLIERFTKEKELTPEQKLEKERKEVEDLEKQIHGSLPWWVIYPAWVLVFFASTCPALFTLFYSMMWGKDKSNAWLTTQALSFFQDTFVSRPVKIIIITTLVALILKKKPRVDEPAAEPLEEGDEMVTSGIEKENKADVVAMCKPPNAKRVAAIRNQKLREKKMAELLRELALFIVYLLLLFMVSAGNRDIRAYKQRAVIDTMLIHGGSKHSPTYKLSNVNNVRTFWKYVNKTFIPSVYYNTWYNGDLFNYTGYSAFRETKRLGITRLRQLRVKNNTCIIHKNFRGKVNECNDKFSMGNEDKKWYKTKWTSPAERSGKQKKRFSPWKYASGKESRNIIPIMATLNTYPGGGYLGELGINEEFSQMYAKYMVKYRWVDKYTRSVFLEFTLYNANLNLISVGTLMFEFFSFGGALPRAEIYVSRLYRSLVPEHKVYLIFDIIFFFYVFFCLFREARKIKRTGKSYFKSIDNLSNAFLVFLGIATMGTYAMRAMSLGSKIDEYNKDPELFISFYQNAMYHELVAVLMSLIDFISIIKFLMFLQFNRNFLTLIQTIVRAAPRIIMFCLYLSMQVIAFVFCSHLLFGGERYNFSSIQRSVYSLNLLLLGVFDWEDFMSRPKLGPILFMSYCILMTFMLMNIFMTILMEVYAIVQLDEELAKREFKLFEYIMDSAKMSVGLKKPIGLGDDEPRKRKKDPFVHRLNRTTRSIETRKTPKLNKLLNKVYLDEFIEDIELLCLELMIYSDEFYELVPCSYKVKLQTMLQRGHIDYATYCQCMNIDYDKTDRSSICTTISRTSQKTLDSVPSDFENSISNSMVFLTEELDEISESTTDQMDDGEIQKYNSNAISTELEYYEQYKTTQKNEFNDEPILPDLMEKNAVDTQNNKEISGVDNRGMNDSSCNLSQEFSHSGLQLNSSDTSADFNSSTMQLVSGGKRRKGKTRKNKTKMDSDNSAYEREEPHHEPPSHVNTHHIQDKFNIEARNDDIHRKHAKVSNASTDISYLERDVPYDASQNRIFNPNNEPSLNELQINEGLHRQWEQQMNIDIDLTESTTDMLTQPSHHLLPSQNNGNGVVSARRKRRKKNTQS